MTNRTFANCSTDPAVTLRGVQVPELGDGAVPGTGDPVHAHLRARTVRPGGIDG